LLLAVATLFDAIISTGGDQLNRSTSRGSFAS
jgi:hypothetical protein